MNDKPTMAHIEAVRAAFERHGVQYTMPELEEETCVVMELIAKHGAPTSGEGWLEFVDGWAEGIAAAQRDGRISVVQSKGEA